MAKTMAFFTIEKAEEIPFIICPLLSNQGKENTICNHCSLTVGNKADHSQGHLS